MDTNKLFAALDEMIAQDRPIGETIFLRLLKEVWQVDWTVAPYDVWYRMIEWEVPYFLRFMAFDKGDETEEEQLINDLVNSRSELRRITGPDAKRRMIDLIQEANRIRVTARQ